MQDPDGASDPDPGRRGRLRPVTELIGTMAVVASLVYVGLEVNQNTRAIRTSTSQSVYTQYMDARGSILGAPDVAELMIRADTAWESLTLADSARYEATLDFELNVYEAVHTNLTQGTLEPDMDSVVNAVTCPHSEEYARRQGEWVDCWGSVYA